MGASDRPSHVKPTGWRPSNTVPTGMPAPIFSAIQCSPSGVRREPFSCPVPKRDVEIRYCDCSTYNGKPFAPSSPRGVASSDWRRRTCSVCCATETNNTDSVGRTPQRRQALAKWVRASLTVRAPVFLLAGKTLCPAPCRRASHRRSSGRGPILRWPQREFSPHPIRGAR